MGSPDSARAKRELRREARQRVASLPVEERRAAELRIQDALRRRVAELAPRVVAAYLALPSEVSISPWLEDLCLHGPQVALPAGSLASPVFRELRDLGGLVPGPFGVLEPGPEQRELPAREIDLVLVPGLAFDAAGRRLGRGAGFYDRVLAAFPSSSLLGICFQRQIVPFLPEETHDVRVGAVLSEAGYALLGRSQAPAGAPAAGRREGV